MMVDQNLQEYKFSGEHDVVWARMHAIKLAEAAGFSKQASWSIGTALSELVTNSIKFAQGGSFTLRVIKEGFEIKVEDDGPGIENIEEAIVDGFSEGRLLDIGERGRGLGSGLGAVYRLMDEVTIENKESGGLSVRAVKYLKKSKEGRKATL